MNLSAKQGATVTDHLENLQHAFRESLHSDPSAAQQIDFEISEALGAALLADMDAANDNGEKHMENRTAQKVSRDNVTRAERAYITILMIIKEVEGDEIPHVQDALSIARSNLALARVRLAAPAYMPESDHWQRAEVELAAIEAAFEAPSHPLLKIAPSAYLAAPTTGVRKIPKRVRHSPRRVG